MPSYRFKEEYADAQIVIPGFRKPINQDNLTDEIAAMIIKKFPHLAHNIELAKNEAPEPPVLVPDDSWTKEEIVEWLESKDVEASMSERKDELLQKVDEITAD